MCTPINKTTRITVAQKNKINGRDRNGENVSSERQDDGGSALVNSGQPKKNKRKRESLNKSNEEKETSKRTSLIWVTHYLILFTTITEIVLQIK